MTRTKMIDELETAIVKDDLSFYYTVCEKIKTALMEEQFLMEYLSTALLILGVKERQ